MTGRARALQPIEAPEHVLVVAAHPGDADLAVGGSVARWIGMGATADLICCTSGDAAGDDPNADPLLLAATQEAAQRASAESIGYRSVTFLHRPDGAVANDLALREQLVRAIRTGRPAVVVTTDPRVLFPSRGGVRYTDQRATGMAVADAVEPAARQAMAFTHLMRSEGLAPHAVSSLLLYDSDQPDGYVDIGDSLEQKSAALRAFAGSDPEADAVDAADAGMQERARRVGAAAGVALAEAFAIITLGR